MIKRLFALISVLVISLQITAIDENSFRNEIKWGELPEIPAVVGKSIQSGLAAPFAGISNGVLLVGGGANFPDAPVYENGIKMYHDDLFVLRENEGEYEWLRNLKMPAGIAYGISVQLPDGVLCIGGRDGDGAFGSVFKMEWDPVSGDVGFEDYPALPFGLFNMGGALVEDEIYIAGGIVDGVASNTFLKLDLKKYGTDGFRWEKLPDFPGPARIQPVGVAQNHAEETRFFLMSGSSYPEDSADPLILTDGMSFNPKTQIWEEIARITSCDDVPVSLHGGAGMAIGTHHMLFLGGVDYQLFSDAWKHERALKLAQENNDEILYDSLRKEQIAYLKRPPEYYKFNKMVMVYHTITDSWSTLAEYPFPGPAGAPIVKWGNKWIVVNGEIKPGVRSPKVYMGQLMYMPDFGWINWLVLIIYLLAMLYLGYFFMKRESGTDDFFKGGGRVPWWVAGFSIFATMLSAITFMSIPAKTYATNWLYFTMAITIFALALPVIRFYLPFFRRLNVTTAYEYLEIRFNYGARALASTLFILFMIARMALVLFLPSLALTTVTGIDVYTCIILMGVITIIYCTMGGVEAVVWGDFIQGVVLMGGALLAVLFLIGGTEGGFSSVIDITIEQEKMKTFDFAFDLTKATFWVVLFGGLANNLISYSSDQAVIQRYLTTKDEKDAAKGIWMNGVLSIVISLIFYFIGTALYAYYKTNPLELNIGMQNSDSIFPHFIMSKIPVGLAGLLIAAIFAATMSTVSSNVNSVSTAFTVDFFAKLFPTAPDGRKLFAARVAGAISGALGVGLALLMATWNILSLLDYFNTVLGLMASSLAGLFVMGIFFSRIHGHAAIVGFLTSSVILLLVRSYTDLHFLLYGFIGIVSSVFIAYLYSLIVKGDGKDLDGLTLRTLKQKSR